MRVKGFAALARRGTDGNDTTGLLLDHVRDGEVNDGVDAFQIDANHLVPLSFGHFVDGQVLQIPNAGIGNENIQASQAGDGLFDEFFIVGMTADVGLEGFHTGAVAARFFLCCN